MGYLNGLFGKGMVNSFLTLFVLYINIIVLFSLIYCVVDIFNLGNIVDHYATLEHQIRWSDKVTSSLYFSTVTMLSVGYGDLTPFGWARAVSIMEAMIGYIFPAVIVIQASTLMDKRRGD